MKPGVSIAAAETDLAAVADSLAREFPQTNKGRGVALEGMHDSMIGSDLRLTSMLFLGVVGIRAPHLLRERRQSAARARDRAHARTGSPIRRSAPAGAESSVSC